MIGHGDWRHEEVLLSDLQSPGRARAFVARHLDRHQLQHLVEPVRLIASELATNAVAHAHTDFTVSLSEHDSVVTLGVEDRHPMALSYAGVPDPLAERGRGLMVVDLLSKSWGVSTDPRGAKLVWATFAR